MRPFGKRRNGEAVPGHQHLGVRMERLTLLARSVENRSGILALTLRLFQGEAHFFGHHLKRARHMKNIRALEIPPDLSRHNGTGPAEAVVDSGVGRVRPASR